MLPDHLPRHTAICQLGCIALALLLCALLWPAGCAGVGLGGMLMWLNVQAGSYLGRRALQQGPRQGLFALALGLKFILLLAVVGLVLHGLKPHPLAFMCGLCTYFVGLGLASLQPLGQRPTPMRP